MRVEAAHQDAWGGDAELVAHVCMQDAGNPLDALGSDGVGDVPQRQMGGNQGHAQAAGSQHHHHLCGLGQFGEEFGVPGKGDAALVDHTLVHGGGDHPGEVPVQAALASTGQGLQHERGVGRVELARCYRGRQRGIPNIQAARWRWLLGPLARGNRQQVDSQPQLGGPLGEQVTAGDGNQGWGWASAASSRHRSGPMPAGSPGVTAKRRGFTGRPGRRQAA